MPPPLSSHNNNANNCKFEIREVWEYNLEEEMAVIRDIVQDYPYLAMVRQCVCVCERCESMQGGTGNSEMRRGGWWVGGGDPTDS